MNLQYSVGRTGEYRFQAVEVYLHGDSDTIHDILDIIGYKLIIFVFETRFFENGACIRLIVGIDDRDELENSLKINGFVEC